MADDLTFFQMLFKPSEPNHEARWLDAFACFALLIHEAAEAARINELSDSTLIDRAVRFFSFKDPSLRNALAGSMLLGVCCGLMGAFLVVRKLSLLGDALSHALLPGVALGFLWNMSKDPLAIFVGATLAGLLGAGAVQLLRATTKHKEDAALGFVLASFFGIGICLFTMIQNLPGGNKAGWTSLCSARRPHSEGAMSSSLAS
jgi:manganese/zinc/iron transport system permease protein